MSISARLGRQVKMSKPGEGHSTVQVEKVRERVNNAGVGKGCWVARVGWRHLTGLLIIVRFLTQSTRHCC